MSGRKRNSVGDEFPALRYDIPRSLLSVFFTIVQLKLSFFFGVTVIRTTASLSWSWLGKGRDY